MPEWRVGSADEDGQDQLRKPGSWRSSLGRMEPMPSSKWSPLSKPAHPRQLHPCRWNLRWQRGYSHPILSAVHRKAHADAFRSRPCVADRTCRHAKFSILLQHASKQTYVLRNPIVEKIQPLAPADLWSPTQLRLSAPYVTDENLLVPWSPIVEVVLQLPLLPAFDIR